MASINKWLAGDSTYQQQLAAFNRSRKDYESQYKRQRHITARDYTETQRGMNRQAVTDREDQANNFAGRGILRSGIYAKALADYNTEFNTRIKNLIQGKKDAQEDTANQRTNFLRQLQLEREAAKQDSIRRRAQKLGI